jgi:nucleotide-binding universal stress UspA family protein
MVKTILFATDFSDNAQMAYHAALLWAHSLKAELVVVHAYRFPLVDQYMPPSMLSALDQSLEEEALRHFRTFTHQYPHQANIPEEVNVNIRPILRQGLAADVILEAAKDEDADMVVLGNRGQTGLKNLVGSVTRRVLSKAHCPVLVIPEDIEPEVPTRWVYALDLEEGHIPVIHKLLRMVEGFATRLDLIHVWDGKNEPETPYLEKVRKEFKPSIDKGFVHLRIAEAKDVEVALVDYSKMFEADAIALFHRHRNFWQSLFQSSHSQHLTKLNKIPVLMIPEK